MDYNKEELMKKNKHLFIASALSISLCVVSFFSILSISSTSKTSRGEVWMKDIADSTSLTTLSIPGSHDSGSLHSIADLAGKCQDLSISEQLSAGVRFYDIRLKQSNNSLKVVHGFVDQKLAFASVLKDFSLFLNKHPSEGLIVSIKKESEPTNSNISFEENLKKEIEQYSSIWDTSRMFPSTLKDLRGKIYLISRYENNSIGLDAYQGWLDPDASETSNSFDIASSNLHVQDYYKIYQIEDKQKEILNCLDYSSNNIDKLTLNFSSCYFLNSFPPTYAGSTAKIINSWFTETIKEKTNLGIIVSDFITSDFAEAIYKRNI